MDEADTTASLDGFITQVFNMMTETTVTVPEGLVDNMTSSPTTLPTTTSTQGTTTTTKKPCYVWTQPPCDALIQGVSDFSYYGVFVAYAIGIPGSILTLIILARMRPFNSSSAWLCCLACVDLTGLTIRMILSICIAFDVGWVNWWCRFYYLMVRGTKHASFFCLVGLTVERFIAVWFPLKMTQWCTVKRALISFFCILVVLISSDMHYIETRRVSGRGSCIIRLKYRPFWQNTYDKFIQMSIYQTLPMIAIITLNILIAVRLRNQRKLQKEMSDQKSKEKDRQQKQIDRMLLAATVFFCLCVLPQIVFQYTEKSWTAGGSTGANFYLERARHITVVTVATLNVLNHAVNFVLYVLVAQKFRSEIIRLFTCGRFTALGKRASSITTK